MTFLHFRRWSWGENECLAFFVPSAGFDVDVKIAADMREK